MVYFLRFYFVTVPSPCFFTSLAPRNTNEFKAIDQNETSITLQWEKVDNILNYTLVFNGSEINVYQVTHTILQLTSGTKYEFSLFTVFESVKSSGVNLTAVTGKMFPRDIGRQQEPGQSNVSGVVSCFIFLPVTKRIWN